MTTYGGMVSLAPPFLTSAQLDVSGQLHTLAALSRGERARYPLDRRLGGPQNRSGRYEEEIHLALPEIDPGPSHP
jgi:hypothetical protein